MSPATACSSGAGAPSYRLVERDRAGGWWYRGMFPSFHAALTARWLLRAASPYPRRLVVRRWQPSADVVARRRDLRAWLETLR